MKEPDDDVGIDMKLLSLFTVSLFIFIYHPWNVAVTADFFRLGQFLQVKILTKFANACRYIISMFKHVHTHTHNIYIHTIALHKFLQRCFYEMKCTR